MLLVLNFITILVVIGGGGGGGDRGVKRRSVQISRNPRRNIRGEKNRKPLDIALFRRH